MIKTTPIIIIASIPPPEDSGNLSLMFLGFKCYILIMFDVYIKYFVELH